MQATSDNSLEDYWEDSSVSWGCAGLSFNPPSCSLHPKQAAAKGRHIHPQASRMISPACCPPPSRPRTFPPPIAFSTYTLSIKAGGRFVLKEIASLPVHGLRAEREQGRLCLHLVESHQVDGENDDDQIEDEEDDDNLCSSNTEDLSECYPYQHAAQEGGLGSEEIIKVSPADAEQSDTTHDAHDPEAACVRDACVQESHAHTGETCTEDGDCEAVDGSESTKSETTAIAELIESQPINSIAVACTPSIHVPADMDPKECCCVETMAVQVADEEEDRKTSHEDQRASRWSSEGMNNIADSLRVCSSKQGLSFARSTPILGLAVS